MKLIEITRKIRFLKLHPAFKQYDVVTTEETSVVMQQLEKERWSFPITLYFESIDEKEEILATKSLQVQEVPTDKTYITFSLKGIWREQLPAYSVQIANEEVLQLAFEEFFHVAEQNFLFVLASEPSLAFEGEESTVSSIDVELLMADYDGQAALFYTTKRM